MGNDSPLSCSDVVASEAIQRKAWRIVSESAPPDLVEALGIHVKVEGSTLYQSARDVPGAQFNKVLTSDLDGENATDVLKEACFWLKEKCSPNSLLMVCHEDRDDRVQRLAETCGLKRHPIDITIFHRDVESKHDPLPGSDIEVRPVSPEQAGLFGHVLAAGLACPAVERWLAACVKHPDLMTYLAYDGAEAIGAAAMLVDGTWGWLSLAAVHPAHRNRGAQTALLARRISDGEGLGVRTLSVGALRPGSGLGDAFASYRNIRRAGFAVAYHRKNYVLDA